VTSGGDSTRLSSDVCINKDKLYFQPSFEEMLNEVQTIWRFLVKQLDDVTPFSFHPSLSQYTQKQISTKRKKDDSSKLKAKEKQSSGLSLNTILTKDDPYQKLLTQIESRLKSTFDDALIAIQPFYKNLGDYNTNLLFSIDKVREEDPPPEFYLHAIEKYKSEMSEMNQIPKQVVSHFLLILLGDFSETIKPTPKSCLTAIQIALPIIAEKKTEDLNVTVTDAYSILNVQPGEIHSFVKQLLFRRGLTAGLEKMKNDYKEITDFYDLMSDNSISVAEDSKLAFRALGTLIGQLEALNFTMKDNEDFSIKKWAPSLSNLVTQLRGDVVKFQNQMNDPIVFSENVTEAIQFLTERKEEFHCIDKRAEECMRYQSALGTSFSSIDELSTAQIDLNLKYLLWTSYKEWKTTTSDLLKLGFKQVSSETLQPLIEKFTRIGSQISSGLPLHQ